MSCKFKSSSKSVSLPNIIGLTLTLMPKLLYSVFDNYDVIVQIAQNYLKYIYDIYSKTEAEFNNANDENYDSGFRYKILNTIEVKYFPTFKLYKLLFNKKVNRSYSEFRAVKWFPDSDDEIETFIAMREPTMEFNKKLIVKHAPRKLTQRLQEIVPVYFTPKHLSIHSFIVGKSGYGKSVLMLQMMTSYY